jgi:hypothetical protein
MLQTMRGTKGSPVNFVEFRRELGRGKGGTAKGSARIMVRGMVRKALPGWDRIDGCGK